MLVQVLFILKNISFWTVKFLGKKTWNGRIATQWIKKNNNKKKWFRNASKISDGWRGHVKVDIEGTKIKTLTNYFFSVHLFQSEQSVDGQDRHLRVAFRRF